MRVISFLSLTDLWGTISTVFWSGRVWLVIDYKAIPIQQSQGKTELGNNLRTETEEDREINHHGRPVKVSGEDDKQNEVSFLFLLINNNP